MLTDDTRIRLATDALQFPADGRCEVVTVIPVRDGACGAPVTIGEGRLTEVDADPRTILRSALMSGADGLVLAHTHPEGGPPSSADLAVTRRLVAAGKLINVPLLGHLVVSPSGWYDCCAEDPLAAFAYESREPA